VKKSEAFPTKYFKAVDFNGPLQLEIETVRFEPFERNGKSEEKAVIYFNKHRSGLVIGPTVWDEVVAATGQEDTTDWKGHRVELYKSETLFQGRTVPCIRIRKPDAPPSTKKKPAPKPPPEFDHEVRFR
jgi:hypothetical protein